MELETLFSLVNLSVLPGWFLLVFLPRWEWTLRLVTTVVIPVLLAVAYGAFLLPSLGGADGGFGSLADVTLLFGDPKLVLAGWIHYLAFDLLVGSLIVRDALRHQVPRLAVFPCLFLCFMAGPLGYLVYLGMRAVIRGQFLFDAPAEPIAA